MQGHGPPPDLSPSALVAYLRERPRPSKVVDFPSETLKGTLWERVRIIVPSSSANGEAQLAAHKRMRDQIKIPLNEWQTETAVAMLNDLTAKEMLARVCYSEKEIAPGKYARLFADSTDVEKCLSRDEVAVLFNLSEQVQFEIGPRLQVLTDGQVDAWVERLSRGFDPLAYLESLDKDVLIRGLVRRLKTASAPLDTSPFQDSQPQEWPNSSESSLQSSAMDTSSSGSPRDAPADGSIPIDEPLSPADAAAIALRMSGKTLPID